MKLTMVILVEVLFFGLTQGQRQFLVEVAGNTSLHEEHNGSKAKHYLVDVLGSTVVPEEHGNSKFVFSDFCSGPKYKYG